MSKRRGGVREQRRVDKAVQLFDHGSNLARKSAATVRCGLPAQMSRSERQALGRSATGKYRSCDTTMRAGGRCSRANGRRRLSDARSGGVVECCRCWRDMGSCGQVVSHPVPASKAMKKRAQEQERGRNGRTACRLSADEYATMHPQCTKGPGPGVVPGTRAFDGGGVEVICTGRLKGEARLVAGRTA